MIVALSIMSIFLYVVLAWQDIKSREFHVILVPLLVISNVLISYLSLPQDSFINVIVENSLFIGLTLIGTYLVFVVREGSFELPSSKIGLGDILILITLIPLFVPLLFKLVFLSIASVGLLLGVAYKIFTQKEEVKIPLAGLLAATCVLLISLDLLRVIDCFNQEMG